MSEDNKEAKKLLELLENGEIDALLSTLANMQPADIADALEAIEDRAKRIAIFNLLDDEISSEVIILLERDIEVDLVNALPEPAFP